MKKKQIINNSSVSDSSSDDGSESSEDENDQINPVYFFDTKELCFYKKIDKFFKECNDDDISTMIDIIEGKSNISLRILDWFVTKYSKKRIDIGNTQNNEVFDVRISYKAQLKSYKKRYFDPFRRKKKFVYHFNDSQGRSMDTTIGQLNFFKWAFTNDILTYVDKNLKQISKEMNLSNKEEKKKKKKKDDSSNMSNSSSEEIAKNKKKKTKGKDSSENLKINAVKTMENGEIKITIKFD